MQNQAKSCPIFLNDSVTMPNIFNTSIFESPVLLAWERKKITFKAHICK